MRIIISPPTQEAAHLESLISYLHDVREDERMALARRIHDELGGLLVAAAMDLGWAEAHSEQPADVRSRLRRLGVNLASAIDMKRNMIEQLRPTLLDNFGLFEALRWYFKHACRPVEADCSDSYPAEEVSVSPLALSHVFRASQTLLDCTFAEEELKSVALDASIEEDALSIRIDHEHIHHETVDVLDRFKHELQSAAHRIAGFRGQISFDRRERGLGFHLQVPLTHMQAATAFSASG
jgi:signal transduction histidine kinase